MGFLTGQDDAREHEARSQDGLPALAFPRFTPENLVKNRPVVESCSEDRREERRYLRASRRSRGCSRSRPFIVPIPGTRRQDHLEENLGARDVVLTKAGGLARDGGCVRARLTVHGERMDAANMALCERRLPL